MSSLPQHSDPLLNAPADRREASALVRTLESIRRRATGLSVTYGVGIVVLAACALLLLGGLSDWLLRLPGVPRLIGLAAAMGILVYLAWRFVWRPASHPPSVSDVAGRAEEAFPEFDDRLRSSLSFLDGGPNHESDPFRDRTIREANDVARNVAWGNLLQLRPAFTSAGGAALSVICLVLVAMLLGPLAGTILGRLLDPLNPTHQWPKRFAVAPLELPDRVAAGRPLEIVTSLSKGDAAAGRPTVYFQVGDGPVRQQLMSQRGDGKLVATIDPRLAAGADRGTARVWVVAGDDRTAPRSVGVVTRPSLTAALAIVTPPEYVNDPSTRQIDLQAEPATVGDGSTVRLQFTFNKPLAVDEDGVPALSLVPVGDVELPDLAFTLSDRRRVSADFVARKTSRFEVQATGVDGFDADASQAFEVIVRPDQSPTVQIDEPRRNEDRTPEATVPVVVTAQDDFGFEGVDFVVEKLAPAGQTGWTATVPLLLGNEPAEDVSDVEQPVAADAAVRHTLSFAWTLADVAATASDEPLQPGDVLEFYAVARDNFAIDGRYHEPVESGRLRVTIISQQQLNRSVISDLRAVKDEVASARRRQDQTRRETQQWREQTGEREALDAADQEALDRLGRQQTASAAQTSRLSRRAEEALQRLEENASPADDLRQLSEDVARALDRAAEGPMREAKSQLDRAASDDAEARQGAAEAAEAEQQDASERLGEVMEQMDQIGSLRQSTDAVRQMLERQRDLSGRTDEVMNRNAGRDPSEMSDEDRQELQELAEEQREMAEESREMFERMAEQAEQMEGDEASAQAMRNAAESGQQQDVPGQQQQAAEQTQQNSRAQAQQARQQAEIGLQIVLNDLQEAEREKMRELQRELAALVEQIERLVRLQAGHNLDNLTLRNAAEGEAAENLAAAAGRNADNAVAPTVARLSAGQEQTERNTRDLSRTAESSEDAATAADSLSRAAARMERAAVAIRQDDLPAAYDPSQVQALAALREALDTAREERDRVADEIEQQQKEAIRDELVTLRDAQAKDVNEPTTAAGERLEAGDLAGRALQRLTRDLSTRQRELAETLDGTKERLAGVGGTVFVYAGERVANDMADVADRLSAREVAGLVATRQARIVSGLDGMIAALEVEIGGNDRFERNSQAGGDQGDQGEGGDSGPQLPSQAELQLVKSLQETINDQTLELAQEKQRGPDAAADLDQQLAAVADEQQGLRGVFDQMLRNQSQGQQGLGPEPDPSTLLPEENGDEPADAGEVEQQLDDRDLLDDLLGEAMRDGGANDDAGEGAENAVQPATGDVARLGDYMARSRQRLGLTQDPGAVTQLVQQRILDGLKDLIEQARQQSQSQSSQSASSGASQQQGQNQTGNAQQQPQPGDAQANAGDQNGQAGGERSTGPQQNTPDAAAPAGEAANLSEELRETLAGWGGLTPRQRAAILEGEADQALDAYRDLTNAFYEKLAKGGDE